MRYAIVKNNIVINVIVWDGVAGIALPEGSTAIKVEGIAGMGWSYDPNTNTFIPPPEPQPGEINKIYTSYEFLNLFTAEERAAFRTAANTDPIVADFQMLAMAAQEVHTHDPMTVAGMNYLVMVGLLTEERTNTILA